MRSALDTENWKFQTLHDILASHWRAITCRSQNGPQDKGVEVVKAGAKKSCNGIQIRDIGLENPPDIAPHVAVADEDPFECL